MDKDVVVNMPEEEGVGVGVGAIDVVVDMSAAEPVITHSYTIDMVQLKDVRANTFDLYAPIEIRTDLLYSRTAEDGLAIKDGKSSLRKDTERSLFFNGKRLETKTVETEESFREFVEREGFLSIAHGYQQNVAGLAKHLMLPMYNKSKNFLEGSVGTNGFGSVFHLENGLGVSSVGYGFCFKAFSFENDYTIPGTIFVRGKKHAAGGAATESARASNSVFKAFLEYTPTLTILNEDHSYSYQPLVVNEKEIIDKEGKLNIDMLKAAILDAQIEEDKWPEAVMAAEREFSQYSDQLQDQSKQATLNEIKELVNAHRITPNSSVPDPGDLVPTLDEAMAKTIFHDLPLVLNGKDIAHFPGLIDAIIWCGDPDLSVAIKKAIGAEISADLIMQYGSGDSTADLAQAYFDALESDNQKLIDDCADLLLNFVKGSSKEVLAECEAYGISELEDVKKLQDKISQLQDMNAKDKVEAALAMKLLMEQVKANDQYKKKHDAASHRDFLEYTFKRGIIDVVRYEKRLEQLINYDWEMNKNLVLSFIKKIKEEGLQDYSDQQLTDLNKALKALNNYYDFLDNLFKKEARKNAPETDMFRVILLHMIAKLTLNSGIQEPAQLIQVLSFLQSWGLAQPKMQDQSSVIDAVELEAPQYKDSIEREDYTSAYKAASTLFEGSLELYKKYNFVFGLSSVQENAMVAFRADIEKIKEEVKLNPAALKFLADILYQESLRLGKWMEQAMVNPEADIAPSFVPIPLNELIPIVLDKKLGALNALMVDSELEGNETVKGYRAQLKGYLDRMKEEGYSPELFVQALSLLYALEKYLNEYCNEKDAIVREKSLSMFPSFSQSGPLDFERPTLSLLNQTLPEQFGRGKERLQGAFTEEVQAILPQALREEIEILLEKEYIEGWEPEIVAKNKRNSEGFKKYNIILNYISGDKVGNQQLPEELKGLRLALVHHLFKEKSIEEIGLETVKDELERWFGTEIASSTSLIGLVNKYLEKSEEKDYESAYADAHKANIGLVSYYRRITGAKRNDPLVTEMNKLISETKEALQAGHITHKVAAETLHQVNLELINCVSYLAGPKNKGFKAATSKEDWNKIGNDSMKAADSPKKKWASRILMGVGIILAVGFGTALVAGFLVVTGGFGAIPLAAVGVAVGSVVSPTIAVAAVGALAASSFGISAGFAYSRRKDVETCKQSSKNYLDSIEEKFGAIEVAVYSQQEKKEGVAVKGDGDCHNGVPIGPSRENSEQIKIESLDSTPVDERDPESKESKPNLDPKENENGHEANAERKSFVSPLPQSSEPQPFVVSPPPQLPRLGAGICSSSEGEEPTATGLTDSDYSSDDEDDELEVGSDLGSDLETQETIVENFGQTFFRPPHEAAPTEGRRHKACPVSSH